MSQAKLRIVVKAGFRVASASDGAWASGSRVISQKVELEIAFGSQPLVSGAISVKASRELRMENCSRPVCPFWGSIDTGALPMTSLSFSSCR